MGDSSKPVFINPLLGFIVVRLQNAFLKKGSTTDFYEILGVAPNASLETIRSSYRRKALEYHPDKIRQRHRRAPTDEEKEMDLKIKEVYRVLSDPRRREIYNRLGSEGYRFAENPGDLLQSEDGPKIIIENFQRNNEDKILALSLIFGIIFAGILQPILICLKIDGHMSSASWAEVFIPFFVFDFFLVIDGFGGLCMPNSKEVDEDGNLPEQITLVDRIKALYQLCIYILFILFQVFLVQKLDGNANSLSWYVVFVPWYLWEILRVLWLIQETCFTTIERPELLIGENEGVDVEEGEDGGAGINNEINMQKLAMYYGELVQQKLGNWTIVVCILRLWFAFFMAAKLAGNIDWNWGLVMLPIWTFLFLEGFFACYFKVDGDMMMDGIDPESLRFNPNIEDHAKVMYGSNMNGACANMCSGGCGYTLMFVLLVCALQVKAISSFIIILPVWFAAFGILMSVFCVFCSLCLADPSQMENPEELSHLQGGNGAYQPPSAFATNAQSGDDIPVVFATTVASETQPVSPGQDGVFKEVSHGSGTPEATVMTSDTATMVSAPPATSENTLGLMEKGDTTSNGDKNPLISNTRPPTAASDGGDKDTQCNDID